MEIKIMRPKKKKIITFEDVKVLLEALNWENPMIEKIVKLADQKKATQHHGIISLMLAISAFLVCRFCSNTSRQILRENGMPEKKINYLLNFSKHLDEI
jgi:hypothetical protein